MFPATEVSRLRKTVRGRDRPRPFVSEKRLTLVFPICARGGQQAPPACGARPMARAPHQGRSKDSIK